MSHNDSEAQAWRKYLTMTLRHKSGENGWKGWKVDMYQCYTQSFFIIFIKSIFLFQENKNSLFFAIAVSTGIIRRRVCV